MNPAGIKQKYLVKNIVTKVSGQVSTHAAADAKFVYQINLAMPCPNLLYKENLVVMVEMVAVVVPAAAQGLASVAGQVESRNVTFFAGLWNFI